jgi:hypothetical protein
MSADLESDLRDVLTDRAGDVRPTPDPWQRTSAGIRAARRRRAAVAGGVLAAAVFAGAALVLPGDSEPPPRPTVASEFLGRTAGPDMATWPVRGSLSGDQAFLRALDAHVQRSVVDMFARVVYAGDVGASRIVVAVTPSGDPDFPDGSVAILAAPRGAAAASLETTGQFPVEPGQEAVAVAAPPRGGSTSYVVLAPSKRGFADMSARPTYDDSGVPLRTWRPLPMVNGVTAGELPASEAVGVRVRVTAAAGYDGPLAGAYVDVPEGVPPSAAAAASRPAPGGTAATPEQVADILRLFAGTHGVRAEDADVTVQWSGSVTDTRRAVLVLFRLSDGAAFQSLRVGEEGPDSSGSQWDVFVGRPLPRSATAAYPAMWLDPEPESRRAPLFVIAPGATAVSVVDGAGRSLYDATVRDGQASGAVDRPDGGWLVREWTLRTQAAEGSETSWPTHGAYDDDPLDLHPFL